MANGNRIPKSKALQWVKNYRKINEHNTKAIFSELFDKKIVLELLKQKNCHGLRIHHGMDEKGIHRVILVATDAKENSLLPDVLDSTSGHCFILEDGKHCPPNCPPGEL